MKMCSVCIGCNMRLWYANLGYRGQVNKVEAAQLKDSTTAICYCQPSDACSQNMRLKGVLVVSVSCIMHTCKWRSDRSCPQPLPFPHIDSQLPISFKYTTSKHSYYFKTECVELFNTRCYRSWYHVLAQAVYVTLYWQTKVNSSLLLYLLLYSGSIVLS